MSKPREPIDLTGHAICLIIAIAVAIITYVLVTS